MNSETAKEIKNDKKLMLSNSKLDALPQVNGPHRCVGLRGHAPSKTMRLIKTK